MFNKYFIFCINQFHFSYLAILNKNYENILMDHGIIFYSIFLLVRTRIKLFIFCSMFSLADEISKFQNFCYNKELDQMIPIDDRLLSEGITIKNLVAENSFIIGEIRKIKDAFINYCKLNDKVYKKIIEHQLNLNTLTTKISSTSLYMDRKVQETSNYLKILHQSMMRENQRAQNMFEENYSPLKNEVSSKVQRQVLPPIVRALIEQYDNQSSNDLHSNPDQQNDKKKKKKISSAQLQEFKTQIQQYFQSLDSKIDSLKQQLNKQTENLNTNIKATNKANNEIEWTRQDLKKLNNDYEESLVLLNNKNQQLKTYIDDKTSEQVWSTKFEEFNKQFVLNPIEKTNGKIDKLKKQTKDGQKQILGKVLLLGGQIHQLQLKIKDIQEYKLKTIKEQIASNAQTTANNFEKVNQQKQNLQKKLKEDFSKIQNKLDGFHNQLIAKQRKLNNKIDKVSSEISGEVLKGIFVKIDEDMKNIFNQIAQFRKKLTFDQQKIQKIQQQLSHIKQIMSKKANFSDMIYISDRKANREDVHHLQEKISSSKELITQYNSLKLKSSSNNSNSFFLNQESSKKGKKALNISRRGMTKTNEKEKNETTAKLFLRGLEEYESPYHRFSTNVRYKTKQQVRPTTANTSQRL